MAPSEPNPVTPPPAPPAVPASEGAAPPTQAPAGFVPQADFEREQLRARTFQGEADRLKAQLAAPPAPQEAPAGTPQAGPGFDPEAFRANLLRDVVGVTQLTQTAANLRQKYPHADPAIFDRIDQYGSADALALAVMDSHARVASILDQHTDVAAVEARIRAEYEARYGGTGTPPSGGSTTPNGDPTPAQLNAMSAAEWDALEQRSPGVIDRVLRSSAAQ